MSPNRIISRLASHIVGSLTVAAVLRRMLLTEEIKPDSARFQPPVPPGDLLPSEKKYVAWASEHTAWVVREARKRLIRYWILASTSGITALAITPAVLVGAPTWVLAVLGFITAVGTFLQGLSHDRELSLTCHQMAVRFQQQLRSFDTDGGSLSGRKLRERFERFREAFEGIKDQYGSEVFRIRGQDPPQIGMDRS